MQLYISVSYREEGALGFPLPPPAVHPSPQGGGTGIPPPLPQQLTPHPKGRGTGIPPPLPQQFTPHPRGRGHWDFPYPTLAVHPSPQGGGTGIPPSLPQQFTPHPRGRGYWDCPYPTLAVHPSPQGTGIPPPLPQQFTPHPRNCCCNYFILQSLRFCLRATVRLSCQLPIMKPRTHGCTPVKDMGQTRPPEWGGGGGSPNQCVMRNYFVKEFLF